jgi:hypothetical protein
MCANRFSAARLSREQASLKRWIGLPIAYRTCTGVAWYYAACRPCAYPARTRNKPHLQHLHDAETAQSLESRACRYRQSIPPIATFPAQNPSSPLRYLCFTLLLLFLPHHNTLYHYYHTTTTVACCFVFVVLILSPTLAVFAVGCWLVAVVAVAVVVVVAGIS